MTHPIDSVLIPGATNRVSKSDFADYVKSRNPFILSSSGEIQTLDLAGTNLVGLGDYFFAYDSTDTTTAHNGTTVLVDSGGRRYKQVTGMAAGTYDPQGIANDAFDVDNMVESATRKFADQTLGVPLPPFLVAGLPAASGSKNRTVSVVDEISGPTPAFSDGLVWRRVSDRAVVTAGFPEASLLLDFEKNIARVNGVNKTMSQVLSCTRAAAATDFDANNNIVGFAPNELRLTTNGFGSYTSRTNVSRHSEPYDDTVIFGGPRAAATRVAVSWLNAAGAGIVQAAEIAYPGTGGGAYAYAVADIVSGNTYKARSFIRAKDGSPLTAGNDSATGDFLFYCSGATLSNRVMTLVDASIGLYSVTMDVAATSTIAANFGCLQYSGQAGKTIQFSGLQIEAGAFIGPYIKTNGASVAVAKDHVVFSDTTWAADRGLFIMEAVTADDWAEGSHHYLGINSTNFVFYDNAANLTTLYSYNGSTSIVFGSLVAGQTFKVAQTVGVLEDVRASIDGGAIITGTMRNAKPTTLAIGSGFTGYNQINSHVKRIVYIPFGEGEMSDAKIQEYAT